MWPLISARLARSAEIAWLSGMPRNLGTAGQKFLWQLRHNTGDLQRFRLNCRRKTHGRSLTQFQATTLAPSFEPPVTPIVRANSSGGLQAIMPCSHRTPARTANQILLFLRRQCGDEQTRLNKVPAAQVDLKPKSALQSRIGK
jgi:hypothetical protein